MVDEELLRYSRQIMLPELDIEGQQRLADARVLIVGLGGLGSPLALYLASSGVGELVLVDDDQVDVSNLQRQIAHTEASIGDNKAESTAARIRALNSMTRLTCITHRLAGTELAALLDTVNLAFDATDNLASRHLLNETCWHKRVPLVSGAAIQWQGQVTLFDANDENSPCYRCLYPDDNAGELSCAENGVIAPLVGIIGGCQALEGIKYLTGIRPTLAGHILYFDGRYMEWRKLRLSPLKNCQVCGA